MLRQQEFSSLRPQTSFHESWTDPTQLDATSRLQSLLDDAAPYQTRLTATSLVPDPGSTLGTAYNLGSLTEVRSVSDSLSSSDRSDIYRFTLDSPYGSITSLHLSLTGLSKDANVRLIRDADGDGVIDSGEVIITASRTGQKDEAIDIANLEPGAYYINVYYGSGATNYTLRLAATGDYAPGQLLPVETNVSTLSGTRTYNGNITDRNMSDVYRFSLSTVSNFNLSLTDFDAYFGDADVRLIQDANNNGIADAGEVVAISNFRTLDNRYTGRIEESINTLLNPGTYLVQVYHGEGDDTHYTLRMSNSSPGQPTNLLVNEQERIFGTPFAGSVDSTNTVNVHYVELGTSGSFNLALTGMTGDANVQLIRDANNNKIVDPGEVVASSALSGNLDESINLNNLAAGNYYIQIYRGSSDANYTLTLSTGTPSSVLPVEVDIGTPNNPVSYWGRVNGSDTADVYRFNIDFTGQLNLGLTDMSGDANVRLIRDTNGDGFISDTEVIATSAFSGNHDEAINYAFLEPGRYFIQVYRGSSDTNFTLRLSTTNPPDPSPVIPTEVNVDDLNGTRTFTDQLSLADAADVYRFTLGSISNFTLALTGLSWDVDVRVIHDINRNNIVDAGDEIARSGNYGNQDEAIDLTGLLVGIYFVQVYRYTGDNTGYTLNLTATPSISTNNLEQNNSSSITS